MANVIKFPAKVPDPGNGAREKVDQYFNEDRYFNYLYGKIVEGQELEPKLNQTDHFLMWLWSEGFKVVPLDGTEEQ